MRRTILLSVIMASSAWAQSNRDSYWIPYQAWQTAGSALEENAGAPTPAFAEQVRATTEAAQAYFNARAASVLNPFPEASDQAAWGARPLATAEVMLGVPQDVQQLLTVAAAKVDSSVKSLPADDKDPAIRRVRQSMERERAALRALMDSLAAAKGPLAALIDASDEAEIQRALAKQAQTAAAGRRLQLAEHVKREGADWVTYYKDLQEGAMANTRGTGAPPPARAKILRPNPDGQISLSRYTGEWIFPNKGVFSGPQPESVEVVVQEANGSMRGTLAAKFMRPMASLTLEFQGPVRQDKTQVFPVQFPDGATGTVELIPGAAYNLLEVNFQSTPRGGSVNTANFVLVKR